jgi:hypothetical protein
VTSIRKVAYKETGEIVKTINNEGGENKKTYSEEIS